MKMFKKLMAVALAGVMALTVLTGCAGTINKKEYVNVLNDMKVLGEDVTIEQGDSALAKEVLSKAKVYAENHSQDLYRTVDMCAVNALSDAAIDEYGSNEDCAKIRSIVPKDTKDQYQLLWTPVDEYKSKEFQNNQEYLNTMIARAIARANSDGGAKLNAKLNKTEAELGTTATASIATQKIGDTTFLVIVLVQAAK